MERTLTVLYNGDDNSDDTKSRLEHSIASRTFPPLCYIAISMLDL